VLVISSLPWQQLSLCLRRSTDLLISRCLFFLTRNTPEEHLRVSKEELAFIRHSNDDKEGSTSENKSFTHDYRFWIF
jgi:hypothetical protein